MNHFIENSNSNFNDDIFISYKNQKITFSEFYHNVSSKSRSLSLKKNLRSDDILKLPSTIHFFESNFFLSTLDPSSKEIASKMIDFPEPVSPEITVNESEKLISKSSIRA